MTSGHRRVLFLSLAPLAALAVFLLHPTWLLHLENSLADRLARDIPPPAPSGDVVVVAIDDASLSAAGRWPWPRAQTAALVDALARARPAAVALAVMFPEPAGDDPLLAAALARSPSVAGYYFESAAPLCSPPSLPSTLSAAEMLSILPHGAGHICNVPMLAASLSGSGFLNISPDPDGVLRRAPLVLAEGEKLLPAFALATVRAARPQSLLALRQDDDRTFLFRLGHHAFHLDANAAILPRLPAPGAFPHISAADILAGRVAPARLNNRIVLIGLTARGVAASPVTAVSPAYPGIDVHAALTEQLLHGGALVPPAAARPAEAIAILLIGLLSGALLLHARPWIAIGFYCVSPVAMVALPIVLFARAGAFLSPLLPAATLVANLAVYIGLHQFERRHHDRLSTAELKSAHDFMLAALASLTTLRDVETGAHLVRVQQCLRLLCNALQSVPRFQPLLTPDVVELLVSVAPIHDIGKIGVPDDILLKRGRLTAAETGLIRQHVLFGQQVLDKARLQSGLTNARLYDMCSALVYCHHERWDGSGYPAGLKGDAIPLPARLLALVDVYDAMATRRVYKPALPHDQVVREIAAGKGTLFDPDIVDVFLANHESFRSLYPDNQSEGRAHAASQ